MKRYWLCGFLFLAVFILFLLMPRSASFDIVLWHDADPSGGVLFQTNAGTWDRIFMVDSLRKDYLLRGKYRWEVNTLLGEPAASGDDIAIYGLVGTPYVHQQIILWLRWQTTMPVLEIHYGKDGRLQEAIVR